jgi:soluble lytic murein transglycosylase-like protein
VEPIWQYALGRTYAMAGKNDEARKILAELEKWEPSAFGAWALAIMYTALGENDKAFQALAYEPSHAYVPWASIDPQFSPLRRDPRFKDLLKKYNLPE